MRREAIYKEIATSMAKEQIEDALQGLYHERDIRKINDPSINTFVTDIMPIIEQEVEDALVIKLIRKDKANLLSFLQARGFLDAFPQEESETT